MSTRGFVEIVGKKYYIRCDAYPSFAVGILNQALKQTIAMEIRSKGLFKNLFIDKANKLAGFEWILIHEKIPKGESFDIFMEYGYKVTPDGIKQVKGESY